jgi:MFS family permease
VAISYLGVGLVAPLIAIVLSEHGANSLIVGLVGTTMFAAFTVGSFPIGKAVDRFGPKPILIGGLIVYGVSILLFALIESVALFFAVRAVEGIGAAGISVATETMINKLSRPDERARRMSYYALSVGLGWAFGPLAGGLLFGVRAQLPFFAGFAFSLLAAILAAGFIPATSSSSHHAEHQSGLAGKLIVPISAGALYGYMMSSLVTLFPLYLKNINIEERQMGSILTAVIGGTLISQVPIGRAADRFGKRRTLLVSSLVLASMFALMASHTDWRSFLLTGAITGAMAGSLYPIGLAIIGGLVSGKKLGAATSMFSLAFGIGSLVGPAISGLSMDHLGNKWLFYLPALLVLAFVVELSLLYRRKPARTAE